MAWQCGTNEEPIDTGDVKGGGASVSKANAQAKQNAREQAMAMMYALLGKNHCPQGCGTVVLVPPKSIEPTLTKEAKPGDLTATAKATTKALVICTKVDIGDIKTAVPQSADGGCGYRSFGLHQPITGTGTDKALAQQNATKNAEAAADSAVQNSPSTCPKGCPIFLAGITARSVGPASDPTGSPGNYSSSAKVDVTGTYACLTLTQRKKLGDFLKAKEVLKPSEQTEWFSAIPHSAGTGDGAFASARRRKTKRKASAKRKPAKRTTASRRKAKVRRKRRE